MTVSYSNLSDQIWILLEGNECLAFSRSGLYESQLPTPEQMNREVVGIQLSYANCGDQDGGIEPMIQAFGGGIRSYIKKIPKNYGLRTEGQYTILKYGNLELHPSMYKDADAYGIVGYWDESNLILLSNEEYSPLLQSADRFIRGKKAKFGFKKAGFHGYNIMIYIPS